MTMRRNAFILAVTIILTGIVLGSAHAAVRCYAGKVTQVGIMPEFADPGLSRSKYVMSVSCTLADGAWNGELRFFIKDTLGDAGYATALTAISTGQTVEVRVAAAKTNSLMDRIYLNPVP